MEERLLLRVPNETDVEAPKKRFDVAERESRLNSIAVLPVFVASLSALLRKLFGEDEAATLPDKIGSPHPDQMVDDQAGRPSGENVEIAAPNPVPGVAAFLPAAPSASMSALPLPQADLEFVRSTPSASAARPAGRTVVPPAADGTGGGIEPANPAPIMPPTANDNDPDDEPIQGPGDGEGPTPGNDGPDNGGEPPQGGGKDDDTDEEDEDDPKAPNRRPTVSGPVVLSDGLVNQAILISISQLLLGAHDADADPLAVRSLQASSGTIQWLDTDRFLYTPSRDQAGEVVFRYEISDGAMTVLQTAHVEILLPSGQEMSGTAGNDVLVGTPYNDVIEALAGDDMVYGREGDDVIHGGWGNDRLVGGDGDDIIYGGWGNDALFGGRGHDTLFGEDGDDVLFGEEGDDLLIAGSGHDLADGGEGDDSLFGDDGDDRLFGQLGDDILDGGAGKDVLDGGEGADTLLGGSGDDALDGGAGDDRAYGGDGDDALFGRSGDDSLHGEAGDDALDGGEGDDVLDGGEGEDTLLGGAGDDALHGEAGDDTLDGGEGDDVLDGGEGDDRLVAGAGDDTVDGGAGDDEIDAGDGNDIIVVTNADGNDIIFGGAGIDTLDLSLVVFDATIDLPDGWTEIAGGGRDLIFDIENIRGGRGHDRLVADDDVNIMTGGAGNDTFIFRDLGSLTNDGGPRDHIMDFTVGDRIDLSRLQGELDDFVGRKLFFSAAADASFSEVGAVTFRHQTDVEDRTSTIVAGNLDEDEEAEFEIVLDGQHELTAQSFILAAREYDHNNS